MRFGAAVLVGLPAVSVFLAAGAPGEEPAAGAARRIPLKLLEDKVRGGWAGQMIGVSYGAPTEFKA